jgi:hypothetical protein
MDYDTTDLYNLRYRMLKNSIDNGLRSLFDEASTSEMIVLLYLHKTLDLYTEIFEVDENNEEGGNEQQAIIDEHIEG